MSNLESGWRHRQGVRECFGDDFLVVRTELPRLVATIPPTRRGEDDLECGVRPGRRGDCNLDLRSDGQVRASLQLENVASHPATYAETVAPPRRTPRPTSPWVALLLLTLLDAS